MKNDRIVSFNFFNHSFSCDIEDFKFCSNYSGETPQKFQVLDLLSDLRGWGAVVHVFESRAELNKPGPSQVDTTSKAQIGGKFEGLQSVKVLMNWG